MIQSIKWALGATCALALTVGTSNAQVLYTPSGGVSTGTGGTAGVGIDADPALAPLDIVGNNFLLRPNNAFNPNGKFIGLGESGGFVGPSNGCDLYGFRAQANDRSFINIGLRFEPDPSPKAPYNNTPTISWGSFDDIDFTSYPKPLQIRYDLGVFPSPCGNVVAQFSGIGYTYTVFGSALASGGSWVNSDARFKQDIQPIGNAMDMIQRLQGTTYTFDRENFPERNFNEGQQYGFIAQDLQEVMPEAVMPDQEGYFGVNYDAVVPVLVEGIKEQQAQLETQAQQMETQEKELETAKTENQQLTNQVDELETVVEQQDAAIRQLQEEMTAIKNSLQVSGAAKNTSTSEEQIQLFQNRPNPFRETTEIHFYLPKTVEQATLVVFNLEGKEIARFGNLDRGYGNVVLEAGSLQPGNYVYRLIADNEVVDSKTLVLSK
ncbi:MAG: tail fiber domain-containing protein [Salibacteraceae bacterium]